MKKNSIGLIELTSIAAGLQVADTMLKAAGVELMLSRSICSGKYMTMVRGDVAEVTSSVRAGCEVARGFIVDTFVIPNLHDSIFPAIYGTNKVDHLESLGKL
jgi:microcompartment protein CcmL/EutN